MARIGMPYISACAMPARRIATGMSRRGLTISSPAAAGSSMPTKLYRSTGATATKIEVSGEKSPSARPCTPCSAP